ncbi:MAG: hypothetical protein H7836_03700 [Magnetococcus sp. YQC-3]
MAVMLSPFFMKTTSSGLLFCPATWKCIFTNLVLLEQWILMVAGYPAIVENKNFYGAPQYAMPDVESGSGA